MVISFVNGTDDDYNGDKGEQQQHDCSFSNRNGTNKTGEN